MLPFFPNLVILSYVQYVRVRFWVNFLLVVVKDQTYAQQSAIIWTGPQETLAGFFYLRDLAERVIFHSVTSKKAIKPTVHLKDYHSLWGEVCVL
jgi:hypothetical protein